MTPEKREKKLQEFDPSTYTSIDRNNVANVWLLKTRESQGLPPPGLVVLLGTGPVELLTLAAHPLMKDATVVGVDVNPGVYDLVRRLKAGKAVSWGDVAEVAMNPGRQNSDFLEKARLENSLDNLKRLGSLVSFEGGINLESIKVPSHIASRVEIVGWDALSFLEQTTLRPDIVGDYFLQINLNKLPNGQDYARKMTHRVLDVLATDGAYQIGDTSRFLDRTISHIVEKETTANLDLVNLSHAVNFGTGVTSSHYLVVTKVDASTRFPLNYSLNQARSMVYGEDGYGTPFDRVGGFETLDLPVSELPQIVQKRLSIVYVANPRAVGQGMSIHSKLETAEAIETLLPEADTEFSEDLVIPAQKPHLRTAINY